MITVDRITEILAEADFDDLTRYNEKEYDIEAKRIYKGLADCVTSFNVMALIDRVFREMLWSSPLEKDPERLRSYAEMIWDEHLRREQ